MSRGISLHAVDVAQGIPAQGMRVAVVALSEPTQVVASGTLGAGGALDHPITGGDNVSIGEYEAHFHVGEWLRDRGVIAGPAFMEIAVFRFTVLDRAQHYHLPLKFTQWGYALFRGS
jgi:5-hydroxyisourate hydrolase